MNLPNSHSSELTVDIEHVLSAAPAQVVAGFTAVGAIVRLVERSEGELSSVNDHPVQVWKFNSVFRPHHRIWPGVEQFMSDNQTMVN